MESLLFPIIMLAVTLTGGGILLLFLKTSKKTPQTDADSAAMQTAQQFINVKDIRDKYLYTRGGMVFIYVRIHAISIDLEDYGTGRPDADADILLLVCGTKPYEIAHTMKLLEQYETKAAFVLCPFVDVALQDTYAKAFQTDYHKVFFLEYQPDCMNGSPNAKIFKTIIGRYIAGE